MTQERVRPFAAVTVTRVRRPGQAEDAPKDGLRRQVRDMAAAFWQSPQRNYLVALAVGLIAVVGATAYFQIRLNAWNQPFYDALTRKNMPAFLSQLVVFVQLAGILLILNVAQMWLNRMAKVVLRKGLVDDLLNQWLAPQRAFRLSNSGSMGSNPDQRLHADAQHLSDLTTDLGTGLLQSTLLLSLFIGVLWTLSEGMFLPIAGQQFSPPGYMVWCALLYAVLASSLSWWVGRPLISLNAEAYSREADFRFALVRASEDVEGIALHGGESAERARLDEVFARVLRISRRIVHSVTGLTWVTAGYGWFTIVAPILVAAPSYFAGQMSFGELMMVVGAFNQVQTSLKWFVDNFSAIADWQATLLRVASFRKTVLRMDEFGQAADRIERVPGPTRDGIRIDGLRVSAPETCVRLSEDHIMIPPGQRVQIVGAHGAGKTLLFRALVGLWPWGRGRIQLPEDAAMLFLPAHAYIPPGSLRAVLAYPSVPAVFGEGVTEKALAAVGLDRLIPLLDTADRWDRLLSESEKQCLSFARAILHRPRWLVIDDAMDRVDPIARRRIEAAFGGPLRGVGVIHIGMPDDPTGFFNRTLRLQADPVGPALGPLVPEVAPR